MKITENIMFINLSFGLPKQSRKIKADANVDPDRLKATCRLYSSAAFAKIKAFDCETRSRLLRLAINRRH